MVLEIGGSGRIVRKAKDNTIIIRSKNDFFYQQQGYMKKRTNKYLPNLTCFDLSTSESENYSLSESETLDWDTCKYPKGESKETMSLTQGNKGTKIYGGGGTDASDRNYNCIKD